jgi:exopolysaccharide production protein ExoQ
MEIVEREDRPNLFSLVNTWILCGVLLVFATIYGFSFERGNLNSLAGQADKGAGGENPGASTLLKVQNIAAYLLSIACIFPLIKPVWRELKQNLLIFSVLGWLIISVLWSDMPQTSLVNAGRMTIDLVLVLYLFERYSGNDIQKLILMVGYAAASGSILMVLAFPQYGLQYRGDLSAMGAWEGIFGQKNICGQVMMLLLLPAFFVKLRGHGAKILLGAYIATALVIIVMTRSAAGWIFSGVCLAFVALLKLMARMNRKDTAVLVAGIVLGTVTFGAILVANFNTVMYALGKDPTLTGRTKIWAVLLNSILKRPLIGYGYVSYWHWGLTGESAHFALQTRLPGYASADSGIVELALELGIVGILLYGIVFLCAAKDACYCFRREASPAVMWYASMLVYVAASNIAGGTLLRPSDLACILPFVAFVGLRREARRLRQSRMHAREGALPHTVVEVSA